MTSHKKGRRRISILVSPQTLFNLQRLADMSGCKELGTVVDKLTRDRMLYLRHPGQPAKKEER